MQKLDLEEFVSFGYLQEVNRTLLHPLGLALTVEIDEHGYCHDFYVVDCRDDPKGMYFPTIDTEKFQRVRGEFFGRGYARKKALGFLVQPVIY